MSLLPQFPPWLDLMMMVWQTLIQNKISGLAVLLIPANYSDQCAIDNSLFCAGPL